MRPQRIGLEAVVPVHSHFDHAMDAAEVARSTGATLVGGLSIANVGRGGGLAEDRMLVVGSGTTWRRGAWSVRMTASHHCPPDRYPGEITAPVIPPVNVVVPSVTFTFPVPVIGLAMTGASDRLKFRLPLLVTAPLPRFPTSPPVPTWRDIPAFTVVVPA